jgi:hypothetical protein
MKNAFLLFGIILTLIVKGYSQNNVLVIKNKTTGKERILHEGKRLKVVYIDGAKYRGTLKINCDSNLVSGSGIMIGKDKLNLDKVRMIKEQPLSSKIIGGVLIGISAVFVTLGIGVIINTWGETPEHEIPPYVEGLASIAGGVIIGTAGLLIISGGKKYSADKWDFYIMQNNSPGLNKSKVKMQSK